MSAHEPVLSIVLVSFNGWSWLEQCLASFQNIVDWSPNSTRYQVILVDNGSTEPIVKNVRKQFPWVTVVPLDENRGFSGGNNVGLAQATAPIVMLLNTDVEWLPGSDLATFLQRFDDEPELGVLSPRVNLADGTLDHACHRGFPTPWNSLWYFSGLARRFPQVPLLAGYQQSWKDLDQAHEIDACTGAAMFVRRTAIEQVGVLDESFFMYGEDIDWCYRFKEADWKVVYDPSLVIRHHKHKSGLGKRSWEVQQRTIEAFYDAMKLFFRKHTAKKYPSWVTPGVFAMIDLLKSRKIQQERRQYDS